MGIRELLRRATPELLARYERELSRIKDLKQFQNILRRRKVIAAILNNRKGNDKNGS